jgi:hypothetical protein
MYALYEIKWTEYERGWGQRPDGETYYPTLEAANKAIKDHYDSQPDGPAPDCYTKPGTPKLVEVSGELYKLIHKRKS